MKEFVRKKASSKARFRVFLFKLCFKTFYFRKRPILADFEGIFLVIKYIILISFHGKHNSERLPMQRLFMDLFFLDGSSYSKSL